MNERVRMLGVGIALVLVAGACSSGPKPMTEPTPVAAPTSPPEPTARADQPLTQGLAIVLSEGKLVSMVPGEKPRVLANARFTEASNFPWCAVDNRAQVVWYSDDTGLNAFDMLDQKTRLVVYDEDESQGIGEILISHGDAGELGSTETVAPVIRLAVHLADGPVRTTAAIGCEGDAAWYCYVDIPADESEEWILVPEMAAREAYLKSLSIRDPAYLQKVATRSNARSLFAAKPLGEELPVVKSVKSEHCVEDPEQCGTAQRITEELWRVVVYNDRGDYYHESEALYDSVRKEYIDIKTGARSLVPSQVEADGIAGIFVSADGKYILSGKTLLSVAEGKQTEHKGTACGFVGSDSHHVSSQ